MQINARDYYLDPQDSESIESIEHAVGRPMPVKLRELLENIGFLQNAISDWPESVNEFVSMQECIPEPYYAVIGDGAGNYFILDKSETLLLWDHETGQSTPAGETFDQCINGNLRPPEDLEDLSWQIQLSLKAKSDESAISFYSDLLGFNKIGPWVKKGTSPAGVERYKADWTLTTANLNSSISKSKYHAWQKNMYSVDLSISLDDIKVWKEKLKQLEASEVDFNVVSYGLLPYDL